MVPLPTALPSHYLDITILVLNPRFGDAFTQTNISFEERPPQTLLSLVCGNHCCYDLLCLCNPTWAVRAHRPRYTSLHHHYLSCRLNDSVAWHHRRSDSSGQEVSRTQTSDLQVMAEEIAFIVWPQEKQVRIQCGRFESPRLNNIQILAPLNWDHLEVRPFEYLLSRRRSSAVGSASKNIMKSWNYRKLREDPGSPWGSSLRKSSDIRPWPTRNEAFLRLGNACLRGKGKNTIHCWNLSYGPNAIGT